MYMLGIIILFFCLIVKKRKIPNIKTVHSRTRTYYKYIIYHIKNIKYSVVEK